MFENFWTKGWHFILITKLEDLEIIEKFRTGPGPLIVPLRLSTACARHLRTAPGAVPTLPCRLSSRPDRRRPAATPRVPRPYPLVPLPDDAKIFPLPPFPSRFATRRAALLQVPPLLSFTTQEPEQPPSSSLRLLEQTISASSQIAIQHEAPTSSAPSTFFAAVGLPITDRLRPWSGPTVTSPSSTSAPRCSPTRKLAPSTSGPGHRRQAPPPEHHQDTAAPSNRFTAPPMCRSGWATAAQRHGVVPCFSHGLPAQGQAGQLVGPG
jgi:hypothetical protein